MAHSTPTEIRLSTVSVDEVVDEAARIVDKWADSYSAISDAGKPSLTIDRAILERITAFAKSGTGSRAHGEADLRALTTALYGSPVTDGIAPDDAEYITTNPLGLVLFAARARLRLLSGAAIVVADLAALDSVSISAIYKFGSDGKLNVDHARPAKVAARDAAEWLTKRGVLGFDGAK